MTRTALVLTFAIATAFPWSPEAIAQYTAIEITDPADLGPDGEYFSLQAPAIGNDGRVVFQGSANYTSEPPANTIWIDDGVAGSPPVPLASGASPADPACQNLFADPAVRNSRCLGAAFGTTTAINANGIVAFEAQADASRPQVTTDFLTVSESQAPTMLLKETTSPSQRFLDRFGDDLSRGGFADTNVIYGWLYQPANDCTRLYASDGTALINPVLGTPAPTPGAFSLILDSCDPPELDGTPWQANQFFVGTEAGVSADGSLRAFDATGALTSGASVTGIFVRSPSSLRLVYEGDVFLSGNSIAVNNAGTVVFKEFLGGVSGVRLATATYPSCCDNVTVASTDAQGFTDFVDWSINESGDVAYLAVDGSSRSLHVWDESTQTSTRVIGTGDAFLGGTVGSLEFSGDGLNDSGDLAAWVRVTFGTPFTSRDVIVKFGQATGTPEIVVTDTVPPSGDLSVDYATVLTGVPETQTVTVANAGSAPLSVSSVALANPGSAVFDIVTETCTAAAVPAGGSCRIDVRFSPPDAMTYNETLSIVSNDADESLVNVQLTGTGRLFGLRILAPDDDPMAATVDGQYDFGPYQQGTTTVRRFFVQNTGAESITIDSTSGMTDVRDDAFNGPFGIASNLVGGAVQGFDIEFSPPAVGPYTATLEVTYSSSADGTVPAQTTSVVVSGDGVAGSPQLTITEGDDRNNGQLDFGTVIVGGRPVRGLSFENTGSATLDFEARFLPEPPFEVLTPICDLVFLQVGERCDLTVRLNANDVGNFDDALTIRFGDFNNQQTDDVLLRAIVVDALIALSDSIEPSDDGIVNFAPTRRNEATMAQVTVTNTSAVDVTLGSLAAATQQLSAPFAVTSENCSDAVLAASASCVIDIEFAPAATTMLGAVEQELSVPTMLPEAAEASIRVSGEVLETAPDYDLDVSIETSVDTIAGQPDRRVVYTITATNLGPGTASGTEVTVALDAALEPIAAEIPSCSVASGDCFVDASGSFTAVWELGELAASESATASLAVEVANPANGCVAAEVTILASGRDGQPANDRARAETGTGSCAEIQFLEEASVNNADGNINLTVPGFALGPDTASGVVFIVNVTVVDAPVGTVNPATIVDPRFVVDTASGPVTTRCRDPLLNSHRCEVDAIPPNSAFEFRTGVPDDGVPRTLNFAIEALWPTEADDAASTEVRVSVLDGLTPPGSNGGCFIATAAYGTYFETEVLTLRGFRDRWLLTHEPGRAFVAAYYRHSPPVADWIADRDWARWLVRTGLTPVVFAIRYPIVAIALLLLLVVGYWRLRHRRRIRTPVVSGTRRACSQSRP